MTGGFVLDPADHAAFAAASGDRSPLHVDPAAARRRYPGEPVAHGVHVLLRAVDHAVTTDRFPVARPRTLRATFVRPVLPGDRCAVEVAGTVLSVLVGGVPVLVLHVDDGPPGTPPPPDPRLLDAPADPAAADAADLRLADLDGATGVAAGVPDPDALARLVPGAVRLLGAGAVADLAAVSALVGMRAPGRRALLADLRVDPTPAPGSVRTAPGLAWWVERTAPAVSRASLAVAGRHLTGRAGVLVLPDPPAPTAAELADRVAPDEFAGTAPLVVGGSRGLGATAARLLALGGADVVITWATDPDAAEAVVADVRAAGGSARAARLDVTDPAAAVAALDAAGWAGDQVHVFASPRILRRHLEAERPELLEELRAVHVAGPVALVEALRTRRGGVLAVGYPSSVAVDDPPPDMREYARAKAEAEAALTALGARWPEVRPVLRRLPRILTEQTVAFTAAPAADAVDELLPLLRGVRDAAARP